MAQEAWRTEADDEWLAGHRSEFLGRLRRRFRGFGGIGEAVSNAETGPFAGAPRNPKPRVSDDKGYSVVRYTTGLIAYTSTTMDPDQCPRCGEPLVERHGIAVAGENQRIPVGVVRTCRRCQSDSWLLRSRMPAVSRARAAARKVVV
jgi:hypothetical protein